MPLVLFTEVADAVVHVATAPVVLVMLLVAAWVGALKVLFSA